MNELIKKFHNQAIEELDPNTVVGSFSEAVVQRVAELIIRECAKVANRAENAETEIRCMYDVITEHFGVEE